MLTPLTTIVKWVSLAVLILTVTPRPSANYQIPLGFVVCAGVIMVFLALFFIKHRIKTRYAVDNRSDLGGSDQREVAGGGSPGRHDVQSNLLRDRSPPPEAKRFLRSGGLAKCALTLVEQKEEPRYNR